MKQKSTLILLALSLLSAGCVNCDKYITNKNLVRPATSSVETFLNGKTPTKPFEQIAVFTWLGPREDEMRATRWFEKQAAKLGADGMLFEWPPHGDQKSMGLFGSGGGAWGSSMSYVFKGYAIRYTN